MQLEGLGASREGLLVSWDGDGAGMNRQTERQKKSTTWLLICGVTIGHHPLKGRCPVPITDEKRRTQLRRLYQPLKLVLRKVSRNRFSNFELLNFIGRLGKEDSFRFSVAAVEQWAVSCRLHCRQHPFSACHLCQPSPCRCRETCLPSIVYYLSEEHPKRRTTYAKY